MEGNEMPVGIWDPVLQGPGKPSAPLIPDKEAHVIDSRIDQGIFPFSVDMNRSFHKKVVRLFRSMDTQAVFFPDEQGSRSAGEKGFIGYFMVK